MNLFNQLQGKKILVTGHTGFKGSWLCRILNKHGANVYGYSLPNWQNSKLYDIINVTNLCINECFDDICNYLTLKQFIDNVHPDIIFHLAAQPLVRQSYNNPKQTFETNAVGTLNVLDCLKGYNEQCQVICITTDKVYENNELGFKFKETDKLGGYDPYSASKVCAEVIIDSYRKSFFNPNEYGRTHLVQLASVRAGNVIGGGDFATDRIIPDIVRSIQNNVKVNVRNPSSIRPWQHVLEPLYGYILLSCRMCNKFDAKWSSAWNFGPGDDSFENVQYIVEEAIKMLGRGSWRDVSSSRCVHEADILKLDIEKSRNVLGWKPCFDLNRALQYTFEWYKAYLNNSNLIEITERQLDEYEQLWIG